MNAKELRVEMIRHDDTSETLAKALGITRQTLSRKMNGEGVDFTKKDMDIIIERYSLSGERFTEIFFANNVS